MITEIHTASAHKHVFIDFIPETKIEKALIDALNKMETKDILIHRKPNAENTFFTILLKET